MFTQTAHDHHWMIEKANGPTSSGTCKHCGLMDEFRNSYDKADYSEFTTRSTVARQNAYYNNAVKKRKKTAK